MITTEQRKTEQYAAITESGRLARQIYEKQADSAPVLEIANLIERRAQLEVDIFRIGGEINTEVMTANLITFMKVSEANHAELKTLMEENGERLEKLSTLVQGVSMRVSKLETRMDTSENDRTDIRARLARLESVNDRLARIEQILADRPAQRDQEHRALVDEVVQRLEARGDG